MAPSVPPRKVNKRSQANKHRQINTVEYDDVNIDWHSHPINEKRHSYPMDVRQSAEWEKMSEVLSQISIPRKKKTLRDYWGYFIQLLMITVLVSCFIGFSMIPGKYMASHLREFELTTREFLKTNVFRNVLIADLGFSVQSIMRRAILILVAPCILPTNSRNTHPERTCIIVIIQLSLLKSGTPSSIQCYQRITSLVSPSHKVQ